MGNPDRKCMYRVSHKEWDLIDDMNLSNCQDPEARLKEFFGIKQKVK